MSMGEQGESPFEVPPEMRRVAEESVDQAKRAIDGFIMAAQKAAAALEEQAAGARGVGEKAMSFAGQNINSSFEFAQQVIRAQNLQELMQIQAEFVKAQMQALADQARELGHAVTKATRNESDRT